VCGLLLGSHDADATRVTRVTRARNLATERLADRYILDPQDYMAADKMARRDGIEIVGIWHTHPDHPARPSRTDLGNAWADYSYVIVAVHDGEVVDLTTWRLNDNNFIQQILKENS
jgi:proteasome lid subunit RPN8/RPN11